MSVSTLPGQTQFTRIPLSRMVEGHRPREIHQRRLRTLARKQPCRGQTDSRLPPVISATLPPSRISPLRVQNRVSATP